MATTMMEEQGVTILKPEMRRLDASEAIAFKKDLHDLITSGHRRILIDLETVDFVDSSGLGAIISGLRLLGVQGDIKLCHVAEQVISLLKLTRLDQLLPAFPNREDALADFI